jgi:hypothetical protein
VGDRPIEFPVEGLSDGVVRLRLMAEADLPAIVAACQDPEIPRWTRVPEPYGDSEARSWFEQEAEQRARGEQLGLLIVDPGNGRLEGSVGIVRVDQQEGRCELGYWMARDSRGRGLANAGRPVAQQLGVREPVGRPDRDPCRTRERRLPAGRRAGGVHPRGGASLIPGEQGTAARRGVVLPAPRRATLNEHE